MAVYSLIFLLSSGSAVAGVSSYQLPYMEDFEAPLTNGMPIGQIGAWSSSLLDASAVVAASYSFSETTRPIDPSADAQVLQLATDSNGVANSFAVPDADQMIYLDSMLKLTPRSSIPASATNDPSVQLFFFMNADTNLVVYHGGLDGSGPVMTVVPVNPPASNDWNRYTVTLDYVHGDDAQVERKYFKVQMNGVDLISAQAYSAPGQTGAYDGGAWFFTADQAGPDRIETVAFEGRGGLDDFVVTSRAPSFSAIPVYYITSELLGQGSMQPSGEIPVVDGSSTQIVYQAAPWHEISGFEQGGVSVPVAVGGQVYTALYENVQADISNLVQFAESVAAVDGKTPASWYGPLGADPSLTDEDGDGLFLYDEYQLNSDPALGNQFVIRARPFADDVPVLVWESLGLPNTPVIAEICTNLLEGIWQQQGGYLSYDGSNTVWRSGETITEKHLYLRVRLAD